VGNEKERKKPVTKIINTPSKNGVFGVLGKSMG
jgi:hypothetical protein